MLSLQSSQIGTKSGKHFSADLFNFGQNVSVTFYKITKYN